MRRASVMLFASLLCSGCAFQSQVSQATVDYNQAVANSSNELTLLNVVRAMHRYPLHFTTISKISGSFRVTGRAGLGADIVEDGGTVTRSATGATTGDTITRGVERFSPSLGAEVAAGPNFDIGILDTQEFYQGILRSVDPDMVGNFLNLGWPSDLVMAMLVERVEFHVPEGGPGASGALDQQLRPRSHGPREIVWSIENDPENATDSAEFGKFLQCFSLRPSSTDVEPKKLWPVAKMDKLKVGDLLALDGEKLSMSSEPNPDERSIERVRPAIKGLTLRDLKPAGESCEFQFKPDHPSHSPQRLAIDIYRLPSGEEAGSDQHHGPGGSLIQLTRPGQQYFIAAGGREDVSATVHIILRSPQAVLYYLGEYARADSAGLNPYRLQDGEPVIVVRRGGGSGAFLRTRLRNESFHIPFAEQERGRSASAIDLAQQLLNLHKSAKDKPTTASFRLLD